MDVLREDLLLTCSRKNITFILFLLMTCCGCAKTGYLIEQGLGQIKILHGARPNKEVLQDVKIPQGHKDKIKQIQKYKKFFYDFFAKKSTAIYDQTTLLDRSAVSYLVIVSPYYKVQAEKECFPFMGCFPYIGFFNKDSAEKYARDKGAEFITYIRPVFAYSTLGYFTDTILSSFFYYDQYDLAEMIFHELFHTIFFFKNEVEFNENLANFFAEKILEDYFQFTETDILKRAQEKKNTAMLNEAVVNLVLELNDKYAAMLNKTPELSHRILNEFIADTFNPKIENLCKINKIKKERCFPLKKSWNNASFAAFLTYQKSAEKIAVLYKHLNLPLKEFLSYIEAKENEFKKKKLNNFSEFLLKL